MPTLAEQDAALRGGPMQTLPKPQQLAAAYRQQDAQRHAEAAERERADAAERAERQKRRDDGDKARAAGEKAAAVLAELKRRAGSGDEAAQAILRARDEAAAAERARRSEEAKRIAEERAMALAEAHAGMSTEELAKVLGLTTPVEIADEDVESDREANT